MEQHSSTAKYREVTEEAPYAHQDFPKLVYKGSKHKSVANQEEEDAAIAAGFSLKAPAPVQEED